MQPIANGPAGFRTSRRALLLGVGLAPVLGSCATVRPGNTATPAPSAPPASTASASPSRTPKPASTPAGDGTRVYGTLDSPATGQTHNWAVIYPPGSSVKAKLPVAIVLHGGGDTFDAVNHLNYHVHLGEAVRAGVRPFALAAINGGVLWWQKMNGQDAGALVATDFVRMLANRGLDTSRLALTGWSMGGWGALRLAGNELAGKVRAVAPISTPLYPDAAAAPDDWMSEAEFSANNPYTHPQWVAGLPVWLACGTSDQFFPGNASFADILGRTPGVPPVQTHFTEGNHDFDFWRSIVADQFRFLGEQLQG